MRYQTIEIGCGNVRDLRFDVRADIQPTPAPTHVADMRDLSQFPDNTFAYAKLAAVIEHITPADQHKAVAELRRVLIPHGLVWVSTPDLQWMKDARDRGDITEEWYETLLRGGERDEFDRHLGLLDAQTMAGLFEAHGFSLLWGLTGDQAGGSLDFVWENGG